MDRQPPAARDVADDRVAGDRVAAFPHAHQDIVVQALHLDGIFARRLGFFLELDGRRIPELPGFQGFLVGESFMKDAEPGLSCSRFIKQIPSK